MKIMSQEQLPSVDSFSLLFFAPWLLYLERGPGDNRTLWFVCTRPREEGEKTGGVCGRVAGERCRGARGVVVAVRFVGGGWFAFGDGPGFNRDVRRDKDGTDRLGERSCCDRAAPLCNPCSALSTNVTLLYPFLLLHLLVSDGCDQCCCVRT